MHFPVVIFDNLDFFVHVYFVCLGKKVNLGFFHLLLHCFVLLDLAIQNTKNTIIGVC